MLGSGSVGVKGASGLVSLSPAESRSRSVQLTSIGVQRQRGTMLLA